MSYELVFQSKDFSLYYVGKRNTGVSYKGGHLYQVEPVGLATQENVLIAEMQPYEVLKKHDASNFDINFNPFAPVYCDEGEAGDQCEAGADIPVHYGGAIVRLKRINGTSGLLISSKGVLWHEARLYFMHEDGSTIGFACLGYVPLTDITKFDAGRVLTAYDRKARDW